MPAPWEVWAAVVSVTAEPKAKVAHGATDALREVDRQWYRCASAASVFTAKGAFLVHVAGTGSLDVGWTPVRWSEGAGPTAHLQYDGDPEFVALSEDGRHACAVTTEEYDYWVVDHHFA
ncbi:hypothetical protein ACSNOK_18510 [Streptomyces sp. URMC 126]|uniref:hypothetical protein n=1 Tax=Streptomyces sp. URMC 126 TaxID=3423401 RepID=UPI003F1C07A6